MKTQTRFDFDPGEHWACIMEDDWALQHKEDREEDDSSSYPSARVFHVVEAVKRTGAWHDYQDVLELGVHGVLARYGMSVVLGKAEEGLLFDLLLDLGCRVQTREVARLAEEEPFVLRASGKEWTVRDEELFRKVFLAGLRRKRERFGFGLVHNAGRCEVQN